MRTQVRPYILCTLLVLFYGVGAKAQKKPMPLVTHDFDHVSAQQFFTQLESVTGWHFYYDSSQIHVPEITLEAIQKPLDEVLKEGLQHSGLKFAIDQSGDVFISRGLAIQADLPEDFWGLHRQGRDIARTDSVVDYLDLEGKNRKTSAKNKLYVVGQKGKENAQGRSTITGYVTDRSTGNPVSGASIHVENTPTEVVTDPYGYYTLSLTRGHHTLSIQSIGLKDTKLDVEVYGDGKLDIDMQDRVIALKNVVISKEKVNNIRGLQMGVQKLDIKAIKQVPVAFGEADILKVMLTLPGVKSVGEASTGLNVRGGSSDQNLILFDDATIYNPSHFFGLFSAFNPEVVSNVELYKSSIPAKYGGRLSSVMDISSRDGNKKKIAGTAGIGLLTSRLTLEGPIVKNKSSFIVGARTTYANWMLNLLPSQYKNSQAGFYDVNLNINQELGKKNILYLMGYMSNDRFNLNSDTLYHYGNRNVSLKWKHIFNNRLYAFFIAGYDRYQYDISSQSNPVNAYDLNFDINQRNLKAQFNYFVNSKHSLEFGMENILYKLHPGNYSPLGSRSLIVAKQMQPEQALESALYISDKYTVTPKFSLEAGVRYSLFNALGTDSFNVYPSGVPKTTDDIIGVKYFGNNQVAKTYQGPEFRLSARYAVTSDFSIKASYNSARQYIHLLSNTSSMAPTDIWKLSDPNIKPQFGNQFSLGFYKNLKENTIETSVEVYYKTIQNYLDYKSGALLILNPHIETDVLSTRGKAYGVEFLLKKATGKLNGWLSYTYSRTFLQANDSTQGEIINQGKYYPASYDIPNDVTLVSNYRVNHRLSFSLNMTYSTGRPITLPIGRFYYNNSERTLYGDRNGYRIPDYFRTDFSINYEGNFKVHQWAHNSWTIGVYNLTGRRNPYSVYFVSENGVVNGYKLS
ncbi:MAG: TonB-dependent receptor, partial [Bacteroidota bacterium]|nr:TonB-dependent receptor [Bacteroidota bacterium]